MKRGDAALPYSDGRLNIAWGGWRRRWQLDGKAALAPEFGLADTGLSDALVAPVIAHSQANRHWLRGSHRRNGASDRHGVAERHISARSPTSQDTSSLGELVTSSDKTDDIVQHPLGHQSATGARRATTVESYSDPRVAIGGGVDMLP